MRDFSCKKNTGNDAAVLYQFCRYVDDVIDETKKQNRAAGAGALKSSVDIYEHQRSDGGPIYLAVQNTQNPCQIWASHLVHGVSRDLSAVSVETTKDELIIPYYVAGVVGLMIAPILGSKRKVPVLRRSWQLPCS